MTQKTGITSGQVQNLQQVTKQLNQININTTTTLVIAGVIFAIVGIIIAIFLSRFVIYPIQKWKNSLPQMLKPCK